MPRQDVTDLDEITRTTLAHYNGSAESFWRGTRDHDVAQNIEALLLDIEGDGPHTILDFGCGPGRDLATFSSLGHEAVGLDGSEAFVRMARAHSGCEVLEPEFRHARPAGRPLRWRVRERVACSMSHATNSRAYSANCAMRIETRRRAVHFEPARRKQRGLERWAIQRLPRLRGLERLSDRSGFRRCSALLSDRFRAAARATALAREPLASLTLAEARMLQRHGSRFGPALRSVAPICLECDRQAPTFDAPHSEFPARRRSPACPSTRRPAI